MKLAIDSTCLAAELDTLAQFSDTAAPAVTRFEPPRIAVPTLRTK